MPDEKKIIIDEDWKSQVAAEKEAAEKAAAEQVGASKQPADEKAAAEAGDFQMPPASLEMLITQLATEALMSLGQIPHPQTGQPIFAPQQAKYLIDTIEMLHVKTKGNTTPQESQLLEEILHQMRMAYVQLAGVEPTKPKPTTST